MTEPTPRLRLHTGIAVLHGVLLVALFLPWYVNEADDIRERHTGAGLLFAGELFTGLTESAVVDSGCVAAWLTVLCLVSSVALTAMRTHTVARGVTMTVLAGITAGGLVLLWNQITDPIRFVGNPETGEGTSLAILAVCLLGGAWLIEAVSAERRRTRDRGRNDFGSLTR
ncbi:hypothetical protein LX16_2517 [Stackebrandtia albiflava]|uniref:Uncharacterized protein n=1 Tax=Stackebrandtia albiflava TaxID=406432 RepID=A0A562V1U3_9ACTN|nr:hypothetical protein [Stackebrandtia albiflava]TWJ11782.1 hypothetical protein LX16_2517 [Stackebrandtia albiflava]